MVKSLSKEEVGWLQDFMGLFLKCNLFEPIAHFVLFITHVIRI